MTGAGALFEAPPSILTDLPFLLWSAVPPRNEAFRRPPKSTVEAMGIQWIALWNANLTLAEPYLRVMRHVACRDWRWRPLGLLRPERDAERDRPPSRYWAIDSNCTSKIYPIKAMTPASISWIRAGTANIALAFIGEHTRRQCLLFELRSSLVCWVTEPVLLCLCASESPTNITRKFVRSRSKPLILCSNTGGFGRPGVASSRLVSKRPNVVIWTLASCQGLGKKRKDGSGFKVCVKSG